MSTRKKESWATVVLAVIWILLICQGLGVLIPACCKRPGPPPPAPPSMDPIPAKETLKGGCNRMEGLTTWTCSHEAIAAAVHALTDATFDLQEARAQHEADLAIGVVDKAELSGQLWEMTQEADHQSTLKWVWGAIGVALGAVATGLVVGLVR